MEYIFAFLGMYVKIFFMKDRNSILGANITSLAIVYQHLSAGINRELDPLNLNMTQLSILSHLARNADVCETISTLSKSMEMNQPMVTKAVKAMVNEGWIEKITSEEDARVSFLRTTVLGKEQLVQAQQACLPIIDKAFTNMEMEELIQFLTLLAKLKINLSK